MGCSGCSRRRRALQEQLASGMRYSRDVASRIRRTLNITDEKTVKYDNIKLTSSGVIKICSKCKRESDPAPTADQIPTLVCDDCKPQ